MGGKYGQPPGRVVVISASMGDGHNAAAHALVEAMAGRWPGCAIKWVDTMELWGPRFARLVEGAYSRQLAQAPMSYARSYELLARWDRAAAVFKGTLGWFFGRRLARVLEEERPDLVVSTYPFGSAAVDWAKRARAITVPAVTYVPAFHVHPTWAYPGIDLHFVMYPSAAAHARTLRFEGSMRMGAPTVQKSFGTIDRTAARGQLGLPADAFIVLMTGGGWGVGAMGTGVEALVASSLDGVHVAAVCGRNSALQSQLSRLGDEHPGRLSVYGYVSTMPELMAASDVVVTNGAGNTVLEALQSRRPVLCFCPLAGHGVASTAEMVKRHLAVRADDVGQLVDEVGRLARVPGEQRALEEAAVAWAAGRDMNADLDEVELLLASQGRREDQAGASAASGALTAPCSASGVTG